MQEVEIESRLLTRQDVAKLANVSRQTIDRAVRSGRLHCFRIGRTIRFSAKHVQEWLDWAEGKRQCQ